MIKNRKRDLKTIGLLLAFYSVCTFGTFLCKYTYASSGHQELVPSMINAIIADDVKGVEALLKRGISVNATSYRRSTFLMLSSTTGNAQIVTILLSAGAKINAKNLSGDTALTEAVNLNHLNVVKILIQHGADVNIQGENGTTPLMFVAYEGNIELIKALLLAKANRHITDKNGSTALKWAIQGNHTAAIQMLQSH